MRAFGRFGRRVAPAGTWRRRGVFSIGGLAVLAVMAFSVTTALGSGTPTTTTIQDNNALELDGNVVAGNGHLANPAVPDSRDWTDVYTCATTASCADGADVRTFRADPFSSSTDNTYTGGSTKDGQGISGWLWSKGAPQAKDDLENAFAAEYKTAQVCADAALTLSCETHQLLFFGADRYSNGGNSDIGFWFLKGQVAPSSPPVSSGGGYTFTGHHTDGDLLVLSTFQNGGVVPQIAVYKWSCSTATTGATCDSSGSLKLDSSSSGADCVQGVDTHGSVLPATFGDYCATVNTGSLPSPWPFTEKSSDGSVVANTFGPGTFFEGGLDMTDLGLAGQCFSSFIAETRASQSTTATLSDFVAGQFALCSASIHTTPSDSGGKALTGAVTPDTSVTDSATVTGSGLNTPTYPTSAASGQSGSPGTQVSFGVCGPRSAAFDDCSSSSSDFASVGSSDLSNTTTQGVSSALSPAFDTSGKGPGYYCFTATWGGDANYTGTITDSGKNGSECFVVQDTTTAASAQSWVPSDSATITSGGGSALNGSVTFTLYPDNDCNVSESAGGATGDTAAFTQAIPLTNATSPATVNTTDTRPAVSTTGATSWSWKVVFAPTAGSNLTGSSHCESTGLTINN